MVINKNSMGYEMNKKERKKLICLYEEYIQNPKDEFIKKDAWNFVSPSIHFFTNPVKVATNASLKIFRGEMTKKRAREILNDLLKEEKEEEEFEKIHGSK